MMKASRAIKSILAAIAVVASIITVPSQAFSDPLPDNSVLPRLSVTITNSETREVLPVFRSDELVPNAAFSNTTKSAGFGLVTEESNHLYQGHGIATYNVDLFLSGDYSSSHTESQPDCKATITAHYDYDGSQSLICIKRVSGSWTPTMSSINVFDKNVVAGQGIWGSQVKKWYPSNNVNSFSYSTGWTNFVPKHSGDGSLCQARSWARVIVPGTGSGHEIETAVIL